MVAKTIENVKWLLSTKLIFRHQYAKNLKIYKIQIFANDKYYND